MARHRNADWTLPEKVETWDQVNAAILMDLRDELQAIRRLLGQAGALLHAIHRGQKPPRISARKAARVLAKRGARKRARHA